MVTMAIRWCDSLTPRVSLTYRIIYRETVFICVEVSTTTYVNALLHHNYTSIQQVWQYEQCHWVFEYWQQLGGPELLKYSNFKFIELKNTVNVLSAHLIPIPSKSPTIHFWNSSVRFILNSLKISWFLKKEKEKKHSRTEHFPCIYSLLHMQIWVSPHHDTVIRTT